LGITPLKVVVLNECLEENEEIVTGTIDNQKITSMNSLPVGEFSLVSYNTEKKCIENDLASVVSNKIDDVYEIELEDGRTIQATNKHPFLVNRNGSIEYVELQYLKEDDEIITIR
jgi:intein/homing endonuclease